MKYSLSLKKITLGITLITISSLFIPHTLNAQGPNAPEAASFEPVDATDMVDLLTGDMTYVLPLLNVPSPEGGYPLTLAYHGGIGYDQEASWIGLGWNLNPGAINRFVNGHPDDWKGAEIRNREYFKYKSESVSGGVGYANYDVAFGYSWDSNKARSGSISVGIGSNDYSARFGLGYSSEDGVFGNLGVGVKGLNINADTRGIISGGYSLNLANDKASPMSKRISSVGISLSSNNGATSINGNAGQESMSLSRSTANSNVNSNSLEARFYLYGAYVRLGYNKTVFRKRKLEHDFVWGPLYYNDLANNPKIGSGNSYGQGLANEHDRDYYMDSYEQKVPKSLNNFITSEDIFDVQKGSLVLPSYDNYMVNAQGLSGVLSPKLFENGTIINAGYNIEYSEEDHGKGNASQCDIKAIASGVNGFGNKIISEEIHVNNHSNQSTKFTKSIGNNGNLYFYFNNQFPQDISVDEQLTQYYNGATNLNQYLNGTQSGVFNRKQNSNFVEVFTNKDIADGVSSFLEAKDYIRLTDNGYREDGIGGYRITATDGKIYHYSRPVYQFEQIKRELYPKNDEGQFYDESEFYKEVRQEEPYATHWLLTAITGPDYIKNSDLNYPSEGDYGYWVRFDYGTWTDGYVWRTPYDGYKELYINESKTAREYSWGRKQLVYLNKIVTRTHTALFVKSLREDSFGKQIGPNYPVYEKMHIIGKELDKDVFYPRQRTLKLDEIILVKNDDLKQYSLDANTQIHSIANEDTHTVSWETMATKTYNINSETKVLDEGDFATSQNTKKYSIYDIAQKVIKLNQSYDLGQGTNSSTDINKGRLTLNSIYMLGKNAVNLTPPYKFDYIEKHTKYEPCFEIEGCNKDDWGFYDNNPALWTLNKISTPTGGVIQFTYEEDEYYTEAFSRKYWKNGLSFKINEYNSNEYIIRIENSPNQNEELKSNFLDFFNIGDTTALDLWICKRHNYQKGNKWIPPLLTFSHPNCKRYGTAFDLNSKFLTKNDYPKVINISKDFIELSVSKTINGNDLLYIPNSHWNKGDYISGETFWKHQDCPSTHVYEASEERKIPDYVNCPVRHKSFSSRHTMVYNLVASKLPRSNNGGGIRVKSITTKNKINNKEYSTHYNYDNPNLNQTSGITSYAPTKGEKFIAYQSELPGPRVMYEYITLTEKGHDNTAYGSTQYKYEVLKPVQNIFNPNMQAGNVFKATVTNTTLDAINNTEGIDVKLENNIAMIGSLLEVKTVNKEGHILNKIENQFYSLDEIRNASAEKAGTIKESFHNMKSVYNDKHEFIKGTATIGFYSWSAGCTISHSHNLRNRYLNTTTKISYPVQQISKKVTKGNFTKLTEFKNVDPKTGMYLDTYSTFSDGTIIITKTIPAYTKYPQMGSKVDDINNKNMLSQETANYTYLIDPLTNIQKVINANITTWNNDWTYRDYAGILSTPTSNKEKIWRKHKNYVWQGEIDPIDGSYVGFNQNNDDGFIWGIGANVTQTNPKWKNMSTTTLYNHYSAPLESRDINGNYTSTKMGDKDSKVLSVSNAKYIEQYYSGAEYLSPNSNYFDGEVSSAGQILDNQAHTGNYIVSIKARENAFKVTLPQNPERTGTKQKFKVSVWVRKGMENNAKIKVEGALFDFNLEEKQTAANWVLLNGYIDIPTSQTTVAITSTGPLDLDDFRLYPATSSMTSYVYNEWDELWYIIGNNGLATRFEYDAAGRLKKTYTEIADDETLIGGFKPISENAYNYKKQ